MLTVAALFACLSVGLSSILFLFDGVSPPPEGSLPLPPGVFEGKGREIKREQQKEGGGWIMSSTVSAEKDAFSSFFPFSTGS